MKKMLSMLITLVITLSCFCFEPLGVVASAASAKMENAIQWAINIANDNSHGYSQSSRWGPDYDCSSFVIAALKSAGYDVGGATYTGNMKSNLESRGFTWIPWSQIGGVNNLQRGDILLNEASHTELYIGNSKNVAASSSRGNTQSGDQDGTEIWVRSYWYDNWDGILRENGEDVPHGSPMTSGAGRTVADGEYHIASYKDSEYGVTVRGVVSNDGANIDLWDDMHTDSNVFIFTYLNNGFYKIINKTTGKALDVDNAGTARGTNVIQWTYNGGDNQQWSIESAGDGVYFIRSKCSGYYLDLYEATIAQGTNIQLWEKTNLDSQGWRLINWSKKPTNVGIHAWVATSPMGGCPDTYNIGDYFYLCYELINLDTGERIGDCGLNYTVTETIYDTKGNVGFTHQDNNDNNYIGLRMDKVGRYSGKITVSGDLSLETTVSCYVGMNATIKLNQYYLSFDLAGGTFRRSVNATISGSLPNDSKLSVDIDDQKAFNVSFGDVSRNENTITVPINLTALKRGTYYGRICVADSDDQNVIFSDTIELYVYCTSPNHGEWKVVSNPTCGTAGSKTRTCPFCGEVETEVLAATGKHNFGAWTTTKSATEYSEGVESRYCKVCNKKETRSTPKLAPSPSDIVGKISDLKAVTNKNSIKLTWSKNTSAKYYKVFVWSNGKCQLLKQINNSSAPNYTAADLKLNTAYKYRVTAYNASNEAIAFSDISTKTLANIANLKATPTKNSVKLTWSRNASAKYYKVFVWKNGKCQLLKQINNSSAPNYTAAGLKLNTAYKYRVTAYNASNKAIAFSDVSAKTLANIANLKAAPSKTTAKLTWAKNTSAKYYKVFVWKNGKWTQLTQTKSNSVLTYTASKLTANTTYKFRVTAYNASNKAIAFSDVTARTLK